MYVNFALIAQGMHSQLLSPLYKEAITLTPWLPWTIFIIGFVLPMAHVAFSSAAGPWRMPQGAKCPFSPKVGWLVIILFLGPVGWLMFMSRKGRKS